MKRALDNKNLLIGTILVSALLAITVVGIFWTPHPPTAIDSGALLSGPSAVHWGGTDKLGRDIFSRTMAAGKTAFSIGIITVSCSMFFGVLLALLAGYFQGWVGNLILRITDAFKSIPSLLFAMMVAAILGRSFGSTTLAITMILIPQFIRMTRANVIKVKENEYIQWTRLVDLGSTRVMLFHILPNVMSTVIITASLAFSEAVLTEAALSYLGLGIQPPDPSWGQMLSEGQATIITSPWGVLLPGAMITMLVLGFNLLGDGLSEVLNAKSAKD
ncbi:MAG TPA: ABC transporter permease [Anaerovoracaceae bacterium]|nr:ABC transporter permease [Anaerovoracaceae bacterium]